jgi:hypothetical protein
VHELGKFKCVNCSSIANNRDDAKRHFDAEHTNVETPSNVALAQLSARPEQPNPPSRIIAVLRKYETISVRCFLVGCGQEFRATLNLNAHLELKHGLNPFVCPIPKCMQSFEEP